MVLTWLTLDFLEFPFRFHKSSADRIELNFIIIFGRYLNMSDIVWRSTEKTDGQSSKQQRHFHPSGLRTLTLSSFFLSGWRQCKNSGRGQYLCLHTTIPTTTTYLLRAKMRFKFKAFHNGNVSEILNLSAVTSWFSDSL